MNPQPVLMADDDEDDCLLAKKAWEKAKVGNPLRFVHDGQELLDYLRHKRKYSDPASAPRPAVILLDLNMPRMDGRTALKHIKEDKELRSIPVIVMTTSKAEEDVVRTYDLGVNSFVTKPLTFDQLVQNINTMMEYWLVLVRIPKSDQ